MYANDCVISLLSQVEVLCFMFHIALLRIMLPTESASEFSWNVQSTVDLTHIHIHLCVHVYA